MESLFLTSGPLLFEGVRSGTLETERSRTPDPRPDALPGRPAGRYRADSLPAGRYTPAMTDLPDFPAADGSDLAKKSQARRSDKPIHSYLAQTTIPAATNILLNEIDQFRHLINLSHSSRIPVSTSTRDSGIPTSERKRLDELIEAFWNDWQLEAKQEMDRTTREAAELGFDTDRSQAAYPFSSEATAALMQILLGKKYTEIVTRHFAKFQGDPLKAYYIMTKVDQGPSGFAERLLGAALLPLIVSKMEEFIAALIRSGISLHPNALGEPPAIPNEVFTQYYTNIESADIQRWQIDQKVKTFMKGSPNDWRKAIRQWTGIEVADLGADWDMIVEMVQRRHVVIHNGGRADSDYLGNIPDRMKVGLFLGGELLSNYDYLSPLLVELEAWALCLSFRWTKHFFKDKGEYKPFITSRAMALAEIGRWSQALAILDSFLLEPLNSDDKEVPLARVNRAFCLQELGRDSEVLRREIIQLKTSDSDDRSILTNIGIYALLRDYPALLEAMHSFTAGPNESSIKRLFREEPLIQRAMSESSQVQSFLLFGGSRLPQGSGGRKKPSRQSTRRKRR